VASSAIRQPDDVFVSVAVPAAAGAGECETAGRPHPAWRPLCLDACPQVRRRLDLFRGIAHVGDRQPLLGEPVGELRRGSHLRLERRTPRRRERPVGERCQLGDLLIVGFTHGTTSQRHGTAKGNGARAMPWRPGPGCAAGLVITS
jgi:hypothetical protein